LPGGEGGRECSHQEADNIKITLPQNVRVYFFNEKKL
jgi:hypothetical protein